MAQEFTLKWDDTGKRTYEAGLSRGVLYPQESGAYGAGVPWNGLTNADENPSGADATPLHANNRKYAELDGNEEFGLTIQAFTYPEEFEACDGTATIAKGLKVSQQTRRPFGFVYRTEVGNDTDGLDHGYKLHLVYGCKAKPSARTNQTIGESPEAATFSWEVTTTPVDVPGFKASAKLTIDSRAVDPEKLKTLEQKLYGFGETAAELPMPVTVIEMIKPDDTDVQG